MIFGEGGFNSYQTEEIGRLLRKVGSIPTRENVILLFHIADTPTVVVVGVNTARGAYGIGPGLACQRSDSLFCESIGLIVMVVKLSIRVELCV